MGEIGRDRCEYLYEMSYCDILLIIRGYRRRNILQYQLQRIQAFASMFCMDGNKDGKQPQDIIPLYFDRYKSDKNDYLTPDEQAELQAEMDEINQMNTNNENNKIQTTSDHEY